jgi:PhoH-like ATPase
MKKNFVFDTNVILHDPQALFKFEDNNIIIPITVVEELDNFKRNIDELGRAARQVGRYMDALREQGSLSQGVAIGNGGVIRIDLSADDSILPKSFMGKRGDNLILATAYKLHRDHPEIPTVFVTKDINLRLKADALGMKAVDYEAEGGIGLEEMDKGYARLVLADDDFNKFLEQGWLEPPDGFATNRLVIFTAKSDSEKTAFGICDGSQKKILRLQDYSQGVYGIKPRNPEQYLALELLLNPRFQLVSLLGKAGTGKTLIGIAAGLHQVLEDNLYQRLLVSRPVFPMGKELGFLPGDVEEKMQPWMQPIFDNLDFIFQSKRSPEDQARKKGREPRTPAYQDLLGFGLIQVEPLTYIRGRSIPGQYIIVDEAQNLTPHEAKTIITRAGLGTKIVLTGDPYQIDNPYLDQSSNALAYLVNKLKGEPLFGHIFLVKGERSQLAELAAERL